MLTRTKMALAAALLVTSAVGVNAAGVNLSDPETAQFYINQYQAQPQQQPQSQQHRAARSSALNARAEFVPNNAGTSRSLFADHAKGIVW